MNVDAAWPLLATRTAQVVRVIGTSMASLRISGVRDGVTIRVPSTSLAWAAGQDVIAGGIDRHGTFKLVAIERGPERFWTDQAFAEQHLPGAPTPVALPPVGPPAFLAILTEHGLLPEPRVVKRAAWKYDAIGVLIATYEPREAIAHGFVHYDHKWRNDTDDVIADLAEILGQQGRLFARERGRRGGELLFAVTEVDGAVTEHAEDNLDDAAAVIDAWLERIDAPRRLLRWDTGDDHISLLARALDEGRALSVALGIDTLVPAHQPQQTAADDPDSF